MDDPSDTREPPGGTNVVRQAELLAEEEGFDERFVRARVRPYALTLGRTRARSDLAIETLVARAVTSLPEGARLSREHRAIFQLADQPVSVAEIAARLPMMLGVTKVLVGDLVDGGALVASESVSAELATAAPGGNQSNERIRLLERVLDGLQAL